MFVFEWYDKSIGVPTVSIGSYGITLNAAVINMFPKNTKSIKLGFDKSNNVIGIVPMTEIDSSSFEIDINNDKGWIRIYSKEFIRYIELNTPDINLSKTEKYMVEWDEEFNMVVVRLNKKIKTNNENDKEDGYEEQNNENDEENDEDILK